MNPETARKWPLRFIGMVLAILCLVSGCETPSGSGIEKNGKRYGVTEGSFRHTWWNYYERGLSFGEGGFYREALADLQQALTDREADQRMARTYGMHFVDYFPHRECGVIYYLTGNLDAAQKELNTSLSQFPSSKARFYLDRVRKAMLEKTVSIVRPPVLDLHPDGDLVWTRDDPVVLSGIAESDCFVSSIVVNEQPVFMEGAGLRREFSEKLALAPGTHVVTVTAKNLLGGAVTRRVVFHVDREGPVIAVEDMGRRGGGITLRAFVSDDAGVAEIRVNHQRQNLSQNTEVLLDATFASTDGSLEITASDRLGNTTSAHLSPARFTGWLAPRLSAGLISDGEPFLSAAEDQSPVIALADWSDRQTVYLEKIHVSGEARDEVMIESLVVNGNPVLRRKGRSIHFNALIDLQEGENTITIEAGNRSGKTAKKQFVVTRGVPLALQLSERLKLTVMPFDQKGELAQASLAYYDSLMNALEARNRFQIVARDKLDAILQEQKLSRTDLVDSQTALRLGKLVAAQSIITGSIIETKTGIEIVGRMIDTETSEIMTTKDVYDENRDIPAIKLLAEGMSAQLVREFPLLGGIVLQSKGNNIFTDLGEGKIALKRRVIIYREEPVIHPVTGKAMGADNVILGKALVSQVSPDMSKAEIIQGDPKGIKPMEKVITE